MSEFQLPAKLLSLPYRYELLSELSRAEVLFLSAVIYAVRLVGLNKWVKLSDETIRLQTGLSRSTIYRCRKKLKQRGLILVDESWFNFYMITEEQEQKMLETAKKDVDEKLKFVLSKTPDKVKWIIETLADLLDAKPCMVWIMHAQRLHEMGVTPEMLKAEVELMRKRGLVVKHPRPIVNRLMRRDRRKIVAQKQKENPSRKQHYLFKWDDENKTYVAIPLPPDAKEDIWEEAKI